MKFYLLFFFYFKILYRSLTLFTHNILDFAYIQRSAVRAKTCDPIRKIFLFSANFAYIFPYEMQQKWYYLPCPTFSDIKLKLVRLMVNPQKLSTVRCGRNFAKIWSFGSIFFFFLTLDSPELLLLVGSNEFT